MHFVLVCRWQGVVRCVGIVGAKTMEVFKATIRTLWMMMVMRMKAVHEARWRWWMVRPMRRQLG